jgi:hypothetical protein
VGAPKPMLLLHQLLDPTTDRLLVHRPRVLPLPGRAGVAPTESPTEQGVGPRLGG